MHKLIKYVPPPLVANKGTKCACCLERTLMKLLKSATLLRVRNSSSLSLRSRGCTRLIMCSLCGHVIHPTVASSVTNAWFGSITSSSWTLLTFSVCIQAKGRTSPYSAPISVYAQFTQAFALITTQSHKWISDKKLLNVATFIWQNLLCNNNSPYLRFSWKHLSDSFKISAQNFSIWPGLLPLTWLPPELLKLWWW